MQHLNHRRVAAPGVPEPEAWMLVLHGIYGAGRNWATVARRFVEARPEWGAVLVDLRQHGDSMGFPPPHDLDACAEDLQHLVRSEGIAARAVLGHSFGGKVGLVYSRDPAFPLSHVWLADSTPDPRTPEGSAWGMLRVLRLHPGPFADRAAGIAAVQSEGYADAVGQWMSTNLIHGPDGYRWRLAADDMESLIQSFFDTDAWDAVERPGPDTHVHLIRATKSGVLTEEACERVEAAEASTGRAHLHQVESTHWLNADNPDALHELLVSHTD